MYFEWHARICFPSRKTEREKTVHWSDSIYNNVAAAILYLLLLAITTEDYIFCTQ